jgi:biotin transport system substrate-specific component
MIRMSAAARTLLDTAWPQDNTTRRVGMVVAVVFGVCLLTLSAKIQVPFWPVPMTMQTLVVLMLGMAYGSRLAVGTVLAYLLAGAVGLPVFAGTPERGIGLAYMMGPTAGFLVGFLIAAWIVGFLAERGWDRNFLTCGAAMIAGHVAISLSGVVWLAILFGTTKAIDIGLVPFLASSALKTALGTAAMPLIWRFVARRP